MEYRECHITLNLENFLPTKKCERFGVVEPQANPTLFSLTRSRPLQTISFSYLPPAIDTLLVTSHTSTDMHPG